jgi:hypothetical protein
VTKQARLRLLLALNVAAVLLLIGSVAWHRHAHAIHRITPDFTDLADKPMSDYCRNVQAMLKDSRFDDLNAEAAELTELRDRFHGGVEKLVVFYNALVNPGCDGFDCNADYAPRSKPLQDWLDQGQRSAAAWIANAWFWENYAWTETGCAAFRAVTFDRWETFYQRVRKARALLAHDGLRGDPAYYMISLDVLRDTGGTRNDIDAMFRDGHTAFPQFLRLDSEYARMLDPTLFGKEGDVGLFAETLLDNVDGDDGQIAYAIVAEEAARYVPYPHLFLETGLNWAKTKAGLALMEQKYGASNRDWNFICYMAMVAIDRPAALDAYRHFDPLWDPAIWRNADYFYGQALPWMLYER